MNARTSDRRNSRLTSELPTLSNFEKHVTELKLVRCRNSRHMSELPTVGTPDLRRNSRPSRLLKTSCWLLVITRTVNPPSQLECETSELPTHAGTPDRRNSRPTSELPTNQPENNRFAAAGQIPDTSGMNTGHVRYEYRTRPVLPDQQEISQLFLSLKYTKLTWVGLSTYETLSINMMHPS